MLKTLPALAALAVATALVVPTVSQAAETTSVRVSYADLNLGTDFGQNRLQRRIAFAASQVCGTGGRVADQRYVSTPALLKLATRCIGPALRLRK